MKEGYKIKSLLELEEEGLIQLGRGVVINKVDLLNFPGDYPVYSSAQLDNGVFGRYGKYMFDEELITWSVDGGGTLFYRNKHKFSITNVGGYCRILRTDLINYQYLYLILTYLHSTIKFDWVKKAHPSVLRKEYKTIPLPSLQEQLNFVKTVNTAFVSIIKAKTNTEKNLKNVNELFLSFLREMFENKGNGWEEKTLGEVAKHSLGKMLDKNKNKGILQKYLRNQSVRWFEFDLSDLTEMPFLESEKEKYTAIKGDVLICEGGYPGRAAIWQESYPIYFQKALHRVRFYNAEYNKWFLYYLFYSDKSGNLKTYFTGTGIQHFTGKSLNKFIIPIPPPNRVKFLSEKMEIISSEIKKLEAIYQQKINDLEELKKSVLQKAFNEELKTKEVIEYF